MARQYKKYYIKEQRKQDKVDEEKKRDQDINVCIGNKVKAHKTPGTRQRKGRLTIKYSMALKHFGTRPEQDEREPQNVQINTFQLSSSIGENNIWIQQ